MGFSLRPLAFKVQSPTFPTVTVGNQTWMAQDLDIDDGGTGIKSIEVIYNNVVYGTYKYYTLSAAIRIAENIGGWHVPTADEWNTLMSTINNQSNALISTEFLGNDTYGFNLKLIGNQEITDSTTSITVGDAAYLQTSTLTAYEGGNYYEYIHHWGGQQISGYMNRYYQVRLIKDT